jgi:hypothetical protein
MVDWNMSPSGSLCLDNGALRPQVWAVVSYVLRLRLVFSMLTMLVGVYACVWPGAVQAQDSVSETHAQHSVHVSAQAQASLLQPAQLPAAPLHEPANEMSDVQSVEDSPDDEEFADVAKWLESRVLAFVQRGPASIQLESSHAPSTQLDRPPRV